jgi:hypothetical protein
MAYSKTCWARNHAAGCGSVVYIPMRDLDIANLIKAGSSLFFALLSCIYDHANIRIALSIF